MGTFVAGEYGRSVLGGVMGDFLGATICCLELAVYLAIVAEGPSDTGALLWLAIVVSLPQIYGTWRRWYERKTAWQRCRQIAEHVRDIQT